MSGVRTDEGWVKEVLPEPTQVELLKMVAKCLSVEMLIEIASPSGRQIFADRSWYRQRAEIVGLINDHLWNMRSPYHLYCGTTEIVVYKRGTGDRAWSTRNFRIFDKSSTLPIPSTLCMCS